MPKAIVSVFDKTSLVPFCQGLTTLGWELIASGGTAKHLNDAQIPVVEVADYTGSPEVLGGRVKTLHPAIHAGLLARDTQDDSANLAAMGWSPIDMAIVNLYPFEDVILRENTSLEEAVEMIDIGGVALMRAAAKNFKRVILASDPQDYEIILSKLEPGEVDETFRRSLAVKGFQITTTYDRAIANYLGDIASETLTLYPIQTLRYGENPHQEATLYGYQPDQTPMGGTVLHGKPLSYNNLLDLDAAWRAAVSFSAPSIVIVKHLSPCGIAVDQNLIIAYQKALASDPVSAFGSVIASNREIDSATAAHMGDLFIECIAAPSFSEEALALLTKKKNLRLVEMPDLNLEPPFEWRSVTRGLLKQSLDMGDPEGTSWQVVTTREPDEAEWRDLQFAWLAVQHVKSNAIVFAYDQATIGIGGGQPNRVDCVHMAIERAGDKAQGAVMASDAFFPFADSISLAVKAGISAIIQPGGSIRDAEVIEAANQSDLAMVFTNVRHFRH